MYSLKIFCVVILTVYFGFVRCCLADSVLDWFNWKPSMSSSVIDSEKDKPVVGEDEDKPITLISIPFEELGHEDKFLLEAEKINNIAHSPLDRCEQKVVMNIQSSCSDLTEEDLARLSISLLNCQSEISGRNQVLCSSSMTLKECISPMDSETWNAYHIINNRARVVCYAIRQQQFRALSEMAVNKLMSSALTQLTNMDNLQELQKDLNLLTAETVSSLRKGHLELLGHTGELQVAQSRAHHTITSNIKHLTLEQTLIQSTHNQLKLLSGRLAKQLESQESQIENVKEQQHHALEEILTSISQITANTDALWTAIEKKSQHLLQQQENIKKSNAETLEQLKQINASVLYLSNLISQIKDEVDQKITWATNFVGGDGALLISVLLNVLYLLAGVLVTLFLQLNLKHRLLLVAAVGTNILLVYRHQSQSYLALTVSIVGCWAALSLAPVVLFTFNNYKSKSKYSKSQNILEKEKIVHEEHDDNVSTKSSSRSDSVSGDYNNHNWNTPFIESNNVDILRMNSNSLNLRRSEPKSQVVCAALCRNGQSCRSTPTPGRQFCKRHLPH